MSDNNEPHNSVDDPNPDMEPFDLDDLPFDEEDDEEGEGASGKGGGKSPKKRYRVFVDHPFLDFADDPNLSAEENAERKLRLLAISPNSILVPGASAFASENDLSRKIFMVDVGQKNGESRLSDMADPDFVDKRDALQRERRTLFGLPHPSLVLSGSMALASAMMAAFSNLAGAISGKNNPEKGQKAQGADKKKAKLFDFSQDKESLFGGPKEKEYVAEKALSGAQPDFTAEQFGEFLEHAAVEEVTEFVEVKRTALSFDSLPAYFNYLSEMAKAPVLRVNLGKEAGVDRDQKGKGGKGGKGDKTGKGGTGDMSDAPTVPWQDFNPAR